METTVVSIANYKHSPLGLIPEDWEVKKLFEVADIKGGFAFDSSKFKDFGNYQVVKMSNFYENNLDLGRSKSFLEEITDKEKESLLTNNDIVITLTGTIGKRDYGYSYLITDEQNLLLNQRLAKIVGKNIVPLFLFYQIKTISFLNQFFYSARGGTGNQANVGTNDLALIKLLCPPDQEQNAIADCLSTWDNAIDKLNALIAQKELSKKALMQQLLSGKKRLKGFSGEWEDVSYGDLLKVVKRAVKWDDNELYKLISVRRRSGGIFFREALLGSQILVKNLRNVDEGDFLFSKMQIVHGASALVTKEFANAKVSGSYIACVAKDERKLNMVYFNWLSKLPYFYHQTYISSYGVHIEKMTFDFESFLSLGIKLPSIEEQTAIAKVLQCTDDELRLLKNKLEQFKEQKKGLMQLLLTGKKRLEF